MNAEKKIEDALTKEEAIELLNKAAKGNDRIILNPSQLARLRALGVDIKVTEGETLQQFFDRAKKNADQVIGKLPPMPEWLEYQFRQQYFEARTNLIMGLNGASITLSAILLESFLKWTAFCVESKDSETFPLDRWQEIEEKMQFGNAIGYAKQQGLVDKKLSATLDEFRKDIRNVQAHSTTVKAAKDVEFYKVTAVDFGTKKAENDQILSAVENPTLSALAKEKLDESRALHVFIFMHNCMEHLFARSKELTKRDAKIG